MKKDRIVKILSFVLCLIILTGSLPITVIAEGVGEIYESVVNNDNSTPENDIPPADPGADDPQSDNVATGEIEVSADAFQLRLNADDKSYTVVGYLSSSNTMHIPSSHNGLPVTRIEEFAFQNKTNLEHVTIPDSIRYIGTEAFSGCVNIRTNDYGGACYIGNENNDHIYLLRARTETKADGFSTVVDENGAPLTEITVKDGTRFVGSYAFQNCNEITRISVPDSVIQIGFKAFRHMDHIESISLPFCGETADGTQNTHFGYIFGAQTYGGNISYVPTDIREIRINGGSRLTGHAFYGIDFVETLALPFIDTYISSLFDGESYQDNIYIPTSLTRVEILGGDTIPAYAFYSCGGLASIVISDSVQTIGDYAFYGCSGLTDVTVGSGVTSIGSRSFYNCIGLTDIVIPADMTEIADEAFYGCTGLFVVYNLSELPLVPGETSYGYVAYYAKLIYDSIEEAGEITTTEEGYTFALVEGTYYLIDYSGTAEELVLPDSFNGSSYEIYQDAFKGCDTLTAVTVPAGVTHIGKGAFADCSRLESITVPFVGASENGTTNTHFGYIFGAASYSENAGCVPIALKNVTITGGKIAANAFLDCSSLTNITMGDRVISIGDGAFYRCSSLTSVAIPDSVTSIGSSAFYWCNSLSAVYITDIAAWCAIEFGGYYANPLYYAHNLYLNGELVTDLVIPDSVTTIGSCAFYNCSSLTSVVIPDSVTSIGRYTFENCSSLESITLPFVGSSKDATTNTNFGYIFGAYSYSYNSDYVPESLKTVIITGGEKIDDSAFYNCSSLTSVVIPDSVTSIGRYAFYNCSSLESITIGNSVTSIGDYAFDYCSGLEAVYITDIAAWCAIDFVTSTSNPLYYARNLYLNGELVTDLVIPDSVTSIGYYTFYNCNNLTSVVIPDSVTSIGYYAFENCSSLTSVYITDIAAWCAIEFGDSTSNPLYYAYNLYLNGELVTDLVIPDGVTSIGDDAFRNCSSLTSVVVPDSVTSIGDYAFSGCSNLTSVVIPDSVTSIGDYAFSGCSNLTSVVIPDSVTSIGDSAFIGCSSLTSVAIGDSVTSIGSSAFSDCSNLESVTIGNGVTSIGYWAFWYCSSLEAVYITDIAAWCAIEFGDSTSNPLYYAYNLYLNGELVTDLVIPDSVTSIGDYAFSGCSNLTSVVIPDSVTSIGDSAFDYCSGLEAVYITDIAAWCAIEFGDSTSNPLYYARNLYLNGELVTDLVIPDSVTSIGYYTFYNCNNLTSVVIPDSVTSIGDYAFSGCSNLTSVVIPDSVTSIGDSAFSGCSSLTSVVIPDSVTSIGDSAFGSCFGLMSVVIPDSVTSIGDNSFHSCYQLTIYCETTSKPSTWSSLWNPANRPVVWGYEINKLLLANDMPELNVAVASFQPTSIQQPIIQNNVASFSDGLTLTPKANVASYSTGADTTGKSLSFALSSDGTYYIVSDCDGSYSQVVIPNTHNGLPVKSIDSSAFFNCSSLTSVVIPDSVTSIGDWAFQNCSSLEAVYITDIAAWCAIDFGNSTANPLYYAHNLYLNEELVTDLVIPDSVTSIGDWAFYNCSNLASVVIPDSVMSIGYSVFSGCSSLEAVYITDIAAWCAIDFGNYYANPLYYAHNLYLNGELVTDLVIPDSVTSIGDYAFYNCSNLASVVIPDSVMSIGYSVFSGCSSLTSVVIPVSVTSIGNYAFSSCYKLKYNTYDNAYYLGNENNPYMVLVKAVSKTINTCSINPATKLILYSAFENCSNLTSVVIPDSVTSIGYSVFSGCSSLTSVAIGDSVSSIGNYAFQNCSSLTSVVIPDSVTSIGNYAFRNCSSLTSVVIPDSVTSIGNYAFSGCSSLTSVVIPDSVTSIGRYTFENCSSLESITLPFVGSSKDATTNTNFGYIFGAYSYSYNSDYVPESLKTVIITSGEKIGYYAFYNCSSLTSVVIPDSVTSIGGYAFSGCSSLTSVTIGNGVTSIGNYAFRNCSSLTSVVIPDSVTSIGYMAFGYCSSLTSVVIPDSVTTIGSSAFSYCSSLESITLPFVGSGKDATTNTHFGYIFGASSYTDNTNAVPASLKTVVITGDGRIFDYAFYGCGGIVKIVIPEGVTEIGTSAFENCISLQTISLPNTLLRISARALSNLNALEVVYYNGESLEWRFISKAADWDSGSGKGGSYTIRFKAPSGLLYEMSADGTEMYVSEYDALMLGIGTEGIGKVVIPEKFANRPVTEIYREAFYNNMSVVSVSIPDSVSKIGQRAFSNCINLTVINIPDTVSVMESGIFSGCTNLGEMTVPFIGRSEAASDVSTAYLGYLFGAQSYAENAVFVPESLSRVTVSGNADIADYMYYGCSDLSEIIHAGTPAEIGAYAFSGCMGLSAFDVPESVIRIGDGAFEDCTGLVAFIFPDLLEQCGVRIFEGCHNLEAITIGANFAGTSDERNGYTLWGLNKSASSLKTYIVSDQNNKYVADDYGILYEAIPVMYASGSELVKVSVVDAPARSNLSNYSLPSHIVEIKQYAFSYNTSLTSIDLAYVRMIGRYAFYSATGLINVRFGTPDVVDEVFEEAVKDLVYITVDENNNVLQYYQYVNLGAFMGCTSLQSVNIDSEMLVGIGEQAFYDCTSLKNVTIGKHIQQIDAQAFGTSGIDGGSIEWFYVPESGSSDKPAYFKSIDGVLYRVNDDGTLTLAFFPANKTQLSDDKTQGYFTQYQNGKPVYATDFALPTADDSGHAVVVCGMENYALNNVRNIISVSLDPSCAFTMGDYALGGSIAQVYIGKHVVTLGEKRGEGEYSVFADCERLETITVDAANTYYCSVDGVLFDKDMSRLVKYPAMKDGALYHVPEEVRVIASMAFKDNKALNNIVISSYISAVGLEAFYNCSALRVIFFNDVYAPGAIMENAFTTNFNEPYTIIGYSEGFYDGGSGTNDIGWSKYNAAYRVEELSEIPEIDTSAGNGFYAIVVVDENGNRINGVTDVGGQPVNTITVSLTDPNGVNETIYVGHDDATGLGDGVATFYDLYGAVGLGLSIQFDEPYTLAIESLNGAYYSYVAEDIYLDIETRVTYVTLVEKPCELYFDANGGTSDTASVPYSVGISTALPNAAFTRPGYTLLGWSTTENGTVAYTEQYHTDVYHPYVILYAVWQANENTVEFNPNSDSVINNDAMADMNIHTDETLQLPANLYEREGFTFIGWSENPNGTPVYTDGDMFTSGYQSVTTLYACWKGNENLLVFDPNGGQGTMDTMVVVSEETYVLDPVTFEKPGYTFDGWATAPEGDVRYEDAGEYTASIAPVQYLYAVWHANSNTIVFDANGGFGEMEVQSGNTDAEIVLQASAFTRNGYVQIGWSTEKDGTLAYRNKASYTVGPEGVVTLYAVWAKMATVYGVSFDETDINSQKIVVNKAEYGDIPGSVTLKNPSKGYTEDNIIYGDMAPETVTVSVVTYFDVENMYIQSAFLMQNGKEVPLVKTGEDFPECGYQLQKNSDSYTVTFLLAAEDLVPEVALECRVAVAAYEGDIENPELSEGAPGSNTYASSFLNIDIIDFTLEESDVKLDTGDLSANFGGVDLLMQIFDGSLNMSVGNNVDVSIVASGDTVTFSLNASAAKDFAGEKSSYTTNYEKGYRDNIEPSSGNTWRFTMLPVSIDGELYMGCVYFARGTQSEGYYYYRCSIKDLYDNEKAVFYGLVNSKTGRSGCAAKVAAILNTYALTVEDGDFGSGTAYYELPPQSYSFKSSGSVKLSLYGDIVTKYDMRTGLVPVSSTVKGAVSFHLEVEGQFTVVVIPVVVGFTVDASGELTLNIGYDDSEGIRIQNLSGEVILEITATAGIGLKRIASLGVYGSAKLEWLFELYPQVYTKRLTVSGKVGAYVQFLWWEYRRDFLNMSKDLINNEPGTMAQLAAMETAALYLMENYTPVAPEEYSEYAQLAVVNGKMYKLHYVSAYNTSGTAVTKLAVSVLDISSGAWSEPVIIEDNGLTDAEFTLFETNDGIYLLYKQEKEHAAGEVEIKDYVSNIDVKLVRFDDSMNPQESVSVIGNGGYQYMTALAVVDGTLTMAWAENSDNNVFGVSPYNYIDSNGISHISPTSANSVWVKQFIDGKWQEARRVANGLSAITDLAISESGHILYIVDENGDLSNSDDRVAYDYSFAYDATAALNPDAPGTISNLKAIDGNLLYTVIGEEKNQVVVYDANGKAITLPENIAEVSDNYRILYKDGEVAAVVFSENISWEENGETQNADAVRGMFRNDGSWGDIVTITLKRANTYITAFDAELDPNNDDILIVTADLIDDEGNVLGSVTEHCVLKSNIVCREYAVDYETRTITYTIANTGARDTNVYAVIHDGGQVGGSGNKVHLASGLKSGTEGTFSVYLYEFFMSSDVGNISIYDSGTGEEIYRHSVDLNFSDLKPYAKQLHIGDKDMILVAVENSGNTANGGTLYVKLGNCSIEEVMTDSYTITIHSIGAGSVSYYEIPIEALTRDSASTDDSIVTLYIEESIAIEKSDKGENNLAYTTFEEYTSKVAEDGSSYTASIGVPVVAYDRAIHTDLAIAYSVSEGHAVTAIRIDGTAVEPGNYDILDNQIILYKSFVEGLAGGTRTMTIAFSNGESCEVQLKVLQYYTVKWYNTDHENPIYSSIVKAGAIPSCAITPFKAADNRYEYHFIGWSVTPGGTVSAVEAISENSPTAYYAVYESVERSCTVTWVVDGKENHETYSFGTTAENVIFNGNTEKASDELYRYTFTGWDKEISDVTGDAIYTAVYSKERITLGEATVSFSDFTAASGKTFTTSLLIDNIDNITRTTIKLKYNPDIVTFIDIIPCEYVEVAEYGASYLLLDIRLPDEATVLSLADISFKANETLTPGAYDFLNIECEDTLVSELCQVEIYEQGDVNMDGIVNTRDLAILRQYIVGLSALDFVQLSYANVYEDFDLNGVPIVNTRDIAVLQQYIVGIIDSV